MLRRLRILEKKPDTSVARQFELAQCRPELRLEDLTAGVDNIRFDVFLSARFTETSRLFIARVLARHAGITDLVEERSLATRPRPANGRAQSSPDGGKAPEASDFKSALTALLKSALERAKREQNPSIDLLARVAVLKLLRAEVGAQYAILVDRCRAKLAAYDALHVDPTRRMQVRERFTRMQAGKKNATRRCAQELFDICREVEKETLARMRRAIFADLPAEPYEILLNRLLFADEGEDDFVNAEHYCMLGHYERDLDKPSRIRELAIELVQELTRATDRVALEEMICAPENAQALVAAGIPQADDAKFEAQRFALSMWEEMLEREGALNLVLAAYQAAPLLPVYGAHINPQQIKNGLIARNERYRIQQLMAEHGLDAAPFVEAAARVRRCGAEERTRIAGRFLFDLFRFNRDRKRLEALNAAAERINLIGTEKLRELSAVNDTLYEFLLPTEKAQVEERVVAHVVIKADVRDSTKLTRSLVEQGLNPASYFSLNFYDPISKLLPKYGAAKVFIEGDAIILAIMEHAGQARVAVGRGCALAREIIEIMAAYNQQLGERGLPTLELGIGICYEDGPPLYLMDGSNRIMISKALNESDRLSANTRDARRMLPPPAGFHVHAAEITGDDEPLRFNVDGIQLNPAGFEKLREEISLTEHSARSKAAATRYASRMFSGVVPLGGGAFREIVIRQGHYAQIDPISGKTQGWSSRCYFEVCNAKVAPALKEEAAMAAV